MEKQERKLQTKQRRQAKKRQKRAARAEKRVVRQARRVACRTDVPVDRKRRREFGRRIMVCTLSVQILFLGLGGRFAYLALNQRTAAVAQSYASVTLDLEPLRNTIYDRNFTPLTDTGTVYYLCVAPTENAVITLSSLLSGEAKESALARLEQGKPVAVEVDAPVSGRGLVTVTLPRRYSGIAPHVLGYLAADGSGATGVELDFDSILSTGQRARISYTEDATGTILTGIEPRVTIPETDSTGVVLTLDERVQRICQEETQTLTAGAVVVLGVESGQIFGMVSQPDYDPLHVADSLADSDAPLINRCLSAYNVGSVFKPVLAAMALENGVPSAFTVDCTGSLTLGPRSFACHKADGHGSISFAGALANSCNVFFYTMSQQLDPAGLLSFCRRWQLGQALYLSDSIQAAAGLLPETSVLASAAGMANFSIGQGDLLLSPLAVAGIYQAIANNGIYVAPTLVAGVFQNGSLQSYSTGQSVQICSAETAGQLQEWLRGTVEFGTGTAAQPDAVTAAGKTATAQTGQKTATGEAVHQAWFAGFYPAENPAFVVVILAENASSGAADCAPLFKRIVDRMVEAGIKAA